MTLHAGMNCPCGNAASAVSVLRLEVALLQKLAGLLLDDDPNGAMALMLEYPHLQNLASTPHSMEPSSE